MNNFFAEIAFTNRIYCDSIGLPSGAYQRALSESEANGTPPNAAERETSLVASLTKLNAMGPLKGMSGHTEPRAVVPHAVVEYARPVSLWDRQDIAPFYEDQRAKHPQLAGCWVGD